MLIGIVDYGAGNIRNICTVLEYLHYDFFLVQSRDDFFKVDTLIIPGVGAFTAAMKKLSELNFLESIQQFAQTGKKILGICLGMQLLFDKSYEFTETQGLGLLQGTVRQIPEKGTDGKKHKIPHMGWNQLIPREIPCDFFYEQDSVYFVHSFMVEPELQTDILAYSDYNGIHIPALIRRENIWGCQFHPEKSAGAGLSLLKKILGPVDN